MPFLDMHIMVGSSSFVAIENQKAKEKYFMAKNNIVKFLNKQKD